jgi:hemin uptake protein HemP
MNTSLHPANAPGSDRSPAFEPDIQALVVDSVNLMNGAREIRIRHGVSLYRLRVTASDKLILTK